MLRKQAQKGILTHYSRGLRDSLAAALVSLSVCAKNVNLYGPEHPVTNESAQEAVRKLREVMASRVTMTVAVTESYLVLGSFPLDDGYEGLVTFAKMLHERGVNQLSIVAGFSLSDIVQFANALNIPISDLQSAGGLRRALTSKGVHGFRVRDHRQFASVQNVSSAAQIYEEALSLVDDTMEAASLGATLPVGHIKALVGDALQSLIADKGALTALARVRSYDKYTSEHSVNVSLLSMLLGEELELEDSLILDLGIAAMLHDVGKVFISKSIVSKPGRLTEEEWDSMKRHPVEGARILAMIPDLPALAATIALQHHCAADGTGYPSLPGAQEPHMLSRLVAIADTFDALTTDRPYRKRWTDERAVACMLYESGNKYDRQIIAKFAARFGLCPVGTLVRLHNGMLAAVVAGTAVEPDKPTLQIIPEPGDGTREPQIINLSEVSGTDYTIETAAQPAGLLVPYVEMLTAQIDYGLAPWLRAANDR